VESYTNRFGSYPDGLDAFIQDFKGSGKSLPAFISQVNENSHHEIMTFLKIQF